MNRPAEKEIQLNLYSLKKIFQESRSSRFNLLLIRTSQVLFSWILCHFIKVTLQILIFHIEIRDSSLMAYTCAYLNIFILALIDSLDYISFLAKLFSLRTLKLLLHYLLESSRAHEKFNFSVVLVTFATYFFFSRSIQGYTHTCMHRHKQTHTFKSMELSLRIVISEFFFFFF